MAYPQPVVEHHINEIKIKFHNIAKNIIALGKSGYIVSEDYEYNLSLGDMLYTCFENIDDLAGDQQHNLDIAYSKFVMI